MEPIRHEVTVACDQRSAFTLFTSGMGSWWDPAYSPDAASYDGIEVDGRVGGAVAMRHGSSTYRFGEVTAWQPTTRYGQTFWLAMSPEHPSALDVVFAAADGVCTIHFQHTGWTEANASFRDKYGDWSHLLGRFAQAAARL